MTNKQTRGERNNNPGNIRISPVKWQGEEPSGDKAFETFATPHDGIRAIARIMMTYWKAYTLKTVTQIISRWAPPSENDTQAYIKAVSGALEIDPEVIIYVLEPATMFTLVKAIIHQENGRVIYDDATIQFAVDSALEGKP